MSDILDQMGQKSIGVETIGPFKDTYYKLTFNGYEVPYIKANLVPGTEDTWLLFLDSRFGIEVSGDELRRWLWFVANAMAVAAGYTSHGEHCRVRNPFMVKVMGIGTVEREV